MRLALGVLVVGLAAPAAAARLRLETSAGIDTNVGRREGAATERESDAVLQLVGEAGDDFRPARAVRVDAGWLLGARAYPEHDGEDGLFQRLDGGIAWGATSWLVPRISLRLEDRVTRDPEQPRDRARLAASPGLGFRFGDFSVGVGGETERFVFKPDPDLSADGLGGHATLGYDIGGVGFGVGVGLKARHFEGEPLVSRGISVEGIPYVALGDGRREDESRYLSASVRYGGGWLGHVAYTLAGNASNSLGSSFVSQGVEASATFALPWTLILSGRVALQRLVYDEPQFVALDASREAEGTEVGGESRSSVTIRLERPVGDSFSVVANGGTWFSPFGSGPEYARSTVALGVSVRN